ncbi:MAG TPA: MBL fold metallo-hydrolase [Euzebyales bacterium]|nr:MBL fold metallo-hydrolase [Euzebyales bacterium]
MTDAGNAAAVRPLDAVTVRVRAANPSPMTLSGTNTYLVGAPAGAEVVVVDPGPDLPAHRATVESAIADLGARVVAVVVTHHHADHAEAVGWAEQWGVPAYAFDPRRVPGTRALGDGATLPLAGITLTARHLPGHCSDQLCLQVDQTGAVLTGDHVLGSGTTVIAWPDGDLEQYLASLGELEAMRPSALYPGHGEVVDDAVARIHELAAHRAQRTAQITSALGDGPVTVPAIVAQVYPHLDARLHGAAGRSVRAHLDVLERQGRAQRTGERWHGT